MAKENTASHKPFALLVDPASALEIEALVSAWFDDGHDERASIWVSHDPAQAKRVGERQLVMTAGTLS